jgi:uncharacterized protein (DUF885 family)
MPPSSSALPDLRDSFFRVQLDRYPVISTFLGGDGWDPELAEVNGRLRDVSPAAIAAELEVYRTIETELGTVDPAGLDAEGRVDASLLKAQLAFLVHQLEDLRYHERAVDTYVAEPFRGIDWQIQQMKPLAPGSTDGEDLAGTEAEWGAVAARLRAVPGYVEAAIANLRRGLAADNAPDRRMVERDGIAGGQAEAAYFRTELPSIATAKLGGTGSRGRIAMDVVEAANSAARAFDDLVSFLETAPWPPDDRYAIGEAEYAWRARNNLRLDRSPEELWAYGGEQVAQYTEQLFSVAGEIGRARSLGVTFETDAERADSISAVITELGKDAPTTTRDWPGTSTPVAARSTTAGSTAYSTSRTTTVSTSFRRRRSSGRHSRLPTIRPHHSSRVASAGSISPLPTTTQPRWPKTAGPRSRRSPSTRASRATTGITGRWPSASPPSRASDG